MIFTLRNETELNVGDVLDITLRIEALIPEEDFETKKVLDDSDYAHDYDVWFYKGDQFIGSSEFQLEADFCSPFCDDIEEYIAEEMPQTYADITEYEVFDVDKSSIERQTAKIKIKAIKKV